jgi:predicted transglutaminase-like protease
MRLMDVLVAELFGTFDEESLNYIIDYLYKNNFREDRINLNYKLTKDQAAIIGKILSQRFPSSQREYIINKLVEAKNTKRPPVRFYKKPSMKKCPICNSTKFRVTLVPLGNENVSEKVCENCSYKHIITKEELSLNS